jgi:hypothetical protein
MDLDMPDLANRDLLPNAEIAAREEAVVRAGVAFAASIQDASAAGRGTFQRAISVARPVLIGAGVLAVGGLALGLLRRLPRKRSWRVPATPAVGPWSDLARAAAVAFAAAAGRRLVERWLRGADGRARPVRHELPEGSRVS